MAPLLKHTTFRGKLESKVPIYIESQFEGEIVGKTHLEVAPSAKIRGRIEVDSIRVWGEIEGNISAISKAELKKGAKIKGNIRTKNIEIEEGVFFEGQCEMLLPEDTSS